MIGCKKEEVNLDYASEIEGNYIGTLTYVGLGTTSASSKITRSTNFCINLTLTIGSNKLDISPISVHKSSDNYYTLSYTSSTESLIGTVQVNTLNWTLSSTTEVIIFVGNR